MNLDALIGILIGILIGGVLVYGMRGPSGKAPDDDQGATPRDLEDE